ncbi:relaxase domain-containing protein [Streptomyces sp. NPDC087307]|uniref:relaxase domain-containing protein n=1 Tax=Streptomyces sp. NPDC087307 TaxID=3365782 RepID=UPI003826683C
MFAAGTLSVAKVQKRNAWRYYTRRVAFGDGRRPVGQSLKDAQEMAGLPPGRWLGRGLAALELTGGAEVSERQLELLFGQGRHPDADRIERGLLDDGAAQATARLTTVLGQPIEEIEARKQTPLLALDFTFRPRRVPDRVVGAGRRQDAPDHRAGARAGHRQGAALAGG